LRLCLVSIDLLSFVVWKTEEARGVVEKEEEEAKGLEEEGNRVFVKNTAALLPLFVIKLLMTIIFFSLRFSFFHQEADDDDDRGVACARKERKKEMRTYSV
jgi:hypothetical protein